MVIALHIRLMLALIVFTASSAFATAQTAEHFVMVTPDSKGPNLDVIAHQAGMIFSGTVIKIESFDENRGTDTPYVRITFRVEDAIYGLGSAQTVSINEWSGLWSSNATQRYRIGESILVFYHLPDASGLTSPVGGALGRFPVGADDRVSISPPQRLAMLRSVRLRDVAAQMRQNPHKSSLPRSDLVRAIRLLLFQSQ